jgi:hypothetical protein
MTIVGVLQYLIERGYLIAMFPSAPSTAIDIHEFRPMEDDHMFSYRVVAIGAACEVLRELQDGSAALYFTARRASGLEAFLRRTPSNAG